MAIKLYQWDISVQDELVSPSKFDGSYQVQWHQHGYASMTVEFAALFNTLNNDLLIKSDADGVAAVKAWLKPMRDKNKVTNIRKKYDANAEFYALRTNDTAIKNDIATIVAAVDTAQDAWLDVS